MPSRAVSVSMLCWFRVTVRVVSVMARWKCLAILWRPRTFPTRSPILSAPVGLPAWTAAWIGARAFSVAVSRSRRLRPRRSARAGLRQATSRSPGLVGVGDLGEVLLIEQAHLQRTGIGG